MSYCGKLIGEDLSRNLNKVESVAVGIRRAYCYRHIGDDCKCCKMFTFPCPTTWRPEELPWTKMSKLRHLQPTCIRDVFKKWVRF